MQFTAKNYRGDTVTLDVPGTLVHYTADADGPVSLVKHRGSFAVVYGLQVTAGLTYERAAAEYGACIMHSLCCAGKI